MYDYRLDCKNLTFSLLLLIGFSKRNKSEYLKTSVCSGRSVSRVGHPAGGAAETV